jgi:hypothetical protein
MEKESSRKERKMVKDIINLQLLMDKPSLFVPFVEILDTDSLSHINIIDRIR